MHRGGNSRTDDGITRPSAGRRQQQQEQEERLRPGEARRESEDFVWF
jgi:hypothetical protein